MSNLPPGFDDEQRSENVIYITMLSQLRFYPGYTVLMCCHTFVFSFLIHFLFSEKRKSQKNQENSERDHELTSSLSQLLYSPSSSRTTTKRHGWTTSGKQTSERENEITCTWEPQDPDDTKVQTTTHWLWWHVFTRNGRTPRHGTNHPWFSFRSSIVFCPGTFDYYRTIEKN